MHRLTFSLLLTVVFLSSCDRILKRVANARQSGSIAEQIRITSESKPEIVAAFLAISEATNEHNRVLIQYIDGDQPANELAYSAGLEHLDRSGRAQAGLGKRIIDAVAATRVYEKGMFTPFDTMRRQMKGMPGWTNDAALERRGYIQIIDQEIATYDSAIIYLERGEEPLLRKNFDRQSVPRDVADEFFRLRRLCGKEVAECNRGMFQEQRAALQCYRDALASADPAKGNQLVAEASQHEQKAKQFEDRMVAEIRKQLSASGLL
jgi:hypothetical protein